jgi:putative hemolysin
LTPRIVSPLLAIAALLALPVHAQDPAPSRPTIANPASQNCIDKGGRLSMEKNGAGGEFGVCTFADNLQCEEWAMMRGECRAGGIKVTGFVTPAARYCAITGGTYSVAAAGNTAGERGSCAFAGNTCDAQAWFDGTCTRVAAAPRSPNIIRAHFTCRGGKSIDATFVNGTINTVDLKLPDGRSMSLPETRSGSGARYANADESFVFWNKGNTAFVEENGKTTLDGCATKR